MSGRALAYLTDFLGADSDTEVPKSTLRTPYWESIGSLLGARFQGWVLHPTVARLEVQADFLPLSNISLICDCFEYVGRSI